MHGADVVDLRDGLVLPGFVDTHVHYPQVRAIGGLGMPLLDWLEQCALPEEARLADASYAASVAAEFVAGLVAAGTTTALVFGSHFAPAVDALFAEATRVGLRVTCGLVRRDRMLRADLLTTPERAYDEGLELAKRWHGQGRTRYAVTPRFSLSCTDALLESAGRCSPTSPELWFTSHLNENVAEIEGVRQLFGCDYLDDLRPARAGRAAQRARPQRAPAAAELMLLARHGAAVAHCPTSNAALGSGLFPLRLAPRARRPGRARLRRRRRHRVLAVQGGAAGLLRAAAARPRGAPLTSPHLLHLATSAGADALGLSDTIGDFSVGKQFDALWLRPPAARRRSTSPCGTPTSADDALAKAFALAGPADVAGTWVAGERVSASRRRAARGCRERRGGGSGRRLTRPRGPAGADTSRAWSPEPRLLRLEDEPADEVPGLGAQHQPRSVFSTTASRPRCGRRTARRSCSSRRRQLIDSTYRPSPARTPRAHASAVWNASPATAKVSV